MENPNTWTILEKTIMEEILKNEEDDKKGICGLSLPKRIANALKNKNLINLSALGKQENAKNQPI